MSGLAKIKAELQHFDLSGKSAALIGCGGLGCNVAVHLAGAGIGRLLLCDFDTVSLSNLNRQFMYAPGDVGKKKAELLKSRLSSYAPDCIIEALDKKIISAKDLLFASDCDIMILAVDNTEARCAAQDFCFEKKLPLVNGGINNHLGTCFLCIPGETACLDCAGLTQHKNKNEVSVSSTAGIIGAYCAFLAQRYLSGDSSLAGRLAVFDSGELDILSIKKSEKCKNCKEK